MLQDAALIAGHMNEARILSGLAQSSLHVRAAQAPIVAYVGRLAAQKGMDVFLSAVPALLNAPASSEGAIACPESDSSL